MPTLKEQFWDPVAGFGVTFRTMFRRSSPSSTRSRRSRPRRASTAGTSSTAGPTGWRSASAASCAPGPARPTRSTSRAPPTPTDERFSPGERYGRVYQINYLRCILCGLCIEACPTRALTMTNEYELADNNRADLIYEKRTCSRRCCPAWSSRRTRCGSATTRATTTAAHVPRPSASRPSRREEVRDVIAFWILAPIMVLAALGILFVRKAVHAALLLAVVMIRLAVLYAVQDAPFLFAVQIIVYTGAILMLFLFVLMLVGVDASDSVVETIRGQRLLAPSSAWCSASLLVLGVGQVSLGAVDRARRGQRRRQRPGPRRSCCSAATSSPSRSTSALLITAALGAMVLAHRERLDAQADPGRPGRAADARLRRAPASTRAAADARRVRPAQRGRHPGAAARRHRRRRRRSRGCWPPAARSVGSGDADDVADDRRQIDRRRRRRERRPRRPTEEARPDERDAVHRARPRSCSRSAASGCSSAATRSWCSCASS